MEKLIQKLKEKNLTIASAESYTGGLFGSEITSIPNASQVYLGGVIAYSNDFKKSFLKLSKRTIKKYGVISRECAFEMCKNLKRISKCDIAISFTGNAGPQAMENKKVGLGYIGIAFLDNVKIIEINEENLTRNDFRAKSLEILIENVLKIIKNI